MLVDFVIMGILKGLRVGGYDIMLTTLTGYQIKITGNTDKTIIYTVLEKFGIDGMNFKVLKVK